MLDKTKALLDWAFAGGVEGRLDAGSAKLLELAEKEVDTLRTLPMIVCLCGSTRFKEQILASAAGLTMKGHIVLAPNIFGRAEDDDGKGKDDNVPVSPEQKDLIDALHFRKIDLAARVHVLNVGGYIGKSTHNEITYAVRKQKIVSFAEEAITPWDQTRGPMSIAHYLIAIQNRVKLEEV